MIAAGEADGKVTTAFVTSMDQPLGRAAGNWLEVAESIWTLAGDGPPDLEELSVKLAAQMLVQAHKGGPEEARFASLEQAETAARAQLHNGEALAAFRSMVEVQGGRCGAESRFHGLWAVPRLLSLLLTQRSIDRCVSPQRGGCRRDG